MLLCIVFAVDMRCVYRNSTYSRTSLLKCSFALRALSPAFVADGRSDVSW